VIVAVVGGLRIRGIAPVSGALRAIYCAAVTGCWHADLDGEGDSIAIIVSGIRHS
jgi:hypothetical protein